MRHEFAARQYFLLNHFGSDANFAQPYVCDKNGQQKLELFYQPYDLKLNNFARAEGLIHLHHPLIRSSPNTLRQVSHMTHFVNAVLGASRVSGKNIVQKKRAAFLLEIIEGVLETCHPHM